MAVKARKNSSSGETKVLYCNPVLLLKRPIKEISLILGKRKKYKTTILTPAALNLPKSKDVQVESYRTISPPLLWDWPFPFPDFFTKSWRLMKESNVIHMWVPAYPTSLVISLYKLLFFRKKKLVLTMDTFPAYSFSMGKIMDFLFRIYYRTVCQLQYAAADAITAYTEKMIPYAEQAKVPMKKLAITPTGVDVKTRKASADMRKELGLGKKDKVVLFAGLTTPRKGVDLLLRAAEEVDAHFVIAGDGPEREQYEEIAKQLKIEKRVHFLGFRTDMHNLYHAADAFCLPSRGEGLAGVILEAMAYGVPVVTSDIPGTDAIVTDGKDGLLCPVESASCYAGKLNKVLKDGKLRKKLISNAKKKIKEDFFWEKNIRKFEELYVRDSRV